MQQTMLSLVRIDHTLKEKTDSTKLDLKTIARVKQLKEMRFTFYPSLSLHHLSISLKEQTLKKSYWPVFGKVLKPWLKPTNYKRKSKPYLKM